MTAAAPRSWLDLPADNPVRRRLPALRRLLDPASPRPRVGVAVGDHVLDPPVAASAAGPAYLADGEPWGLDLVLQVRRLHAGLPA